MELKLWSESADVCREHPHSLMRLDLDCRVQLEPSLIGILKNHHLHLFVQFLFSFTCCKFFPLAFLQIKQRNSEAWPPHGVCPGHDKPWSTWGRPHKFTTNFREETTNTWHCRPGEETGANGRERGSDTRNYENCGWSSSERKSKKSTLCFHRISF